ncbi:hypothetical protein IFR04_000707 [Cadophora malorum]|uniref:Uncharacterized protein n=1 Tax=Cadophora malorum TaxID=108018 RepID=A0A8H7WK84_9HELO|nr:hypothetical protein IFR04_000707 [Cadophora malorum]
MSSTSSEPALLLAFTIPPPSPPRTPSPEISPPSPPIANTGTMVSSATLHEFSILLQKYLPPSLAEAWDPSLWDSTSILCSAGIVD